jgi:hypothetical protein
MGDEMFYRYQQSMIDNATTTLALLIQHSIDAPNPLDMAADEPAAARSRMSS